MLDDDDFAILNALYLKKMAGAAALAEATGLPREQVEERLAAAAEAGQVVDVGGGAMLLEDGSAAVLAHYRERYAPVRARPEVVAWYEGFFEPINARFIAQVSEWQQSEGDARAERRLLQTAERLAREIGALVPQVPRYAAYARRLERGMERVDAGQREFVCNPAVDSVHNVWFEFHEDILAVLGRPRDTT